MTAPALWQYWLCDMHHAAIIRIDGDKITLCGLGDPYPETVTRQEIASAEASGNWTLLDGRYDWVPIKVESIRRYVEEMGFLHTEDDEP